MTRSHSHTPQRDTIRGENIQGNQFKCARAANGWLKVTECTHIYDFVHDSRTRCTFAGLSKQYWYEGHRVSSRTTTHRRAHHPLRSWNWTCGFNTWLFYKPKPQKRKGIKQLPPIASQCPQLKSLKTSSQSNCVPLVGIVLNWADRKGSRKCHVPPMTVFLWRTGNN